MKSPCIAYPEDEPLVLIRASQVRLCDGNHCAAALLSYFGYWHTIRRDQMQQAEHANKVAAQHGETGTQDTTLFQYHTEEAIEDGLLHLYGRKTIRGGIAMLVSKGFLSLHTNPNPRYRFDRTHYFLFHPEHVQAALSVVSHEVKVPHREIANETDLVEPENTANSSQVVDISDEVKVPHREGHSAASSGKNTSWSGKNAATIEEITSEITDKDLPPVSTNVETSPKGNVRTTKEKRAKRYMPKEEKAQQALAVSILDDRFTQWQAEHYPEADVAAQWTYFVNYCLSSGRQYADFRAAFMNSFPWENSPAQRPVVPLNGHRTVARHPLSFTEQRQQREAAVIERFLGGTHAGSTGQAPLRPSDEGVIDGVEYRVDR